jgi:dolichol-phosphate mannosyltransferase
MASSPGGGVELTVVVPTFDELSNIAPLLAKLEAALVGVDWEVIFVDDDSPDGTAHFIKTLSRNDRRVRCLHRIGRRGLAGAVAEGAMASSAPLIAVMDADLQHDERLLPSMLDLARRDQADLVIASRYLGQPVRSEGFSPLRGAGSRLAAWMARRVLKAQVSDPVSGFFMIRREAIERVAAKLSDQGFKILFDIIACQPGPLRIVELSYQFRERHSGYSKLQGGIVIDYLGLVLARLSGNLMPPRALLFFLVGASGLAVHLGVLRGLLSLGSSFALAQLGGAVTAMTSNFLLNNAVTYRDRRLRGPALATGYLRFCALCGIGLVANVAVADLVHHVTPIWWLAGTAGALFGAMWNYVSTSLAVW